MRRSGKTEGQKTQSSSSVGSTQKRGATERARASIATTVAMKPQMLKPRGRLMVSSKSEEARNLGASRHEQTRNIY